MLQQPQIDPVALHLGPVSIHWYGIMYLIGFALIWWLGKPRAQRLGLTEQQFSDLIFYCAMGVVLGGRIGYILFYDFPAFVANPLRLFRIWEGGMSFHGGLLGVIVAMFWFAHKIKRPFWTVSDLLAPWVPLGLLAGRIGNFINGELWGRPTDLPWGMVFLDPRAGFLPRHPSQLYEAALEGVLLFVVLWFLARKPRPLGLVSGCFLMGYGLCRFVVEFFRTPDAQLGFIFGNWMSMGQVLSSPMIVVGLGIMLWSWRRTRN